MSIEQDRQYYLLQQLIQSPDKSVKKFAGSKANPKGLDLDGPTRKTAESSLQNAGFVTIEGKPKDKKFVLTDAGAQYFKTLTPFPRPTSIDPKMKAFFLLNLLSTGEGRLSLKQIKALFVPATLKSLGFSKDALAPMLNSLVQEQAIEQITTSGPTPDDSTSYQLKEHGKKELLRSRQHVDAAFKLNGAAINRLIECAMGNGAASSDTAPKTPELTPHAVQVPRQDTASPAAGLTDDQLVREAASLIPTAGRNGLLPIFELRRHLKGKFGERAASHEELDARLKRMRGQRLDLVSIHDHSMVARDQLNEGVQGAGELFFYLRDPR